MTPDCEYSIRLTMAEDQQGGSGPEGLRKFALVKVKELLTSRLGAFKAAFMQEY